MENRTCRLKFKSKESQCGPYLAQFSNGRISIENSDELKIKSYKERSGKHKKILSIDTENLDYASNNDSLLPQQANNLCLCVLNKKTMKMRCYDAEQFHCNPIFQSIKTKKVEIEDSSYIEKRNELTSSFGSKVKQRALKSRLRYEVSEEKLQEKVNYAIEEAVFNTTPHLDVEGVSAIPPQNKDAVTAKEVYNLNDIISEDMYPYLQDKAVELQNASLEDIKYWEGKEDFSKFVSSYLQRHIPNVNAEKSVLLAAYCYMMQFSKLRYNDFRKRDIPALDIPDFVKLSFIQKFTMTCQGPNGNVQTSMPLRMKEKLFCYTLVLALIIEDFELNLMVFQSDFKIGKFKIERMAEVIGCYIVTQKILDEPVRFVTLTIPLNVTKKAFIPKNGRKKR